MVVVRALYTIMILAGIPLVERLLRCKKMTFNPVIFW